MDRRIVAVVGAGSGIGKATAHRLVKDGAHVVCVDRGPAAAEGTAREIVARYGEGIGVAGTGIGNCGPAVGLACDITDRESVVGMLREALLAYGGLDSLVVTGIFVPPVVTGSTMFPRDRVIASLVKYEIPFGESETTDELRGKLAAFYAERSLTRSPIEPEDQAEAILLLVSERLAKTTGHVIPVDGGLQEAFLR